MPAPHGGRLVNGVVPEAEREERLEEARSLKPLRITPEQAREVENIAYGVYSPLEGFLRREEYECVLEHMRLPGDVPWTLPIVLDVEEGTEVREGQRLALWEDGEAPLAVMEVEEAYPLDRRRFNREVYGTEDESHPGVAKTMGMGGMLLGGRVELLREPESAFHAYRLHPRETRVLFREKGWRRVVAFQTRNVPHLGHEYVQKTALTFADGLFINPVIGRKKKGDFTDQAILATYRALMEHYYLRERAVMVVLQYEMRYAGPREAVHHAIMRKNFGCTHFIVGRDHAGVGKFYHPFAAHEIFQKFPDLGIVPVFFNTFFYCRRCGGVVNEKICPHGPDNKVEFSGTRLREMVLRGEMPPPEMIRPEVAEVLLSIEDPFVE
ncbi:MAG: sulfate adenylyltransferase [Actinomycetota bacterium]